MIQTILVFALLLVILPLPGQADSQHISDFTPARAQIDNGGFIITKDHNAIGQFNPHISFIPASTWKIATAALGLHILGSQYRFQTFFYQNQQGQLFIKGKGDPFLISEEISQFMPTLNKQLARPIKALFIDNSAFQLETKTDGSGSSRNPYDADLSALDVNFNTINLTSKDGKIYSAEQQTPYLPIMATFGKISPGRHRISLTYNNSSTIYAGQLFSSLGNWQWPQIKEMKVPPHLSPIYIHRSSKNLSAIITALLLYSNNVIANQIFLTCGAKRFGWPATWEKGQRAMREFLTHTVKLPIDSFTVKEGSGLSRQNHITPSAMLKLLYYFSPHAALLPLHHQQRVKSGTMDKVYNYVGYLGHDKHHDPFVLFLNQARNNRKEVLKTLQSKYDAITTEK